MKIIKEEKGTSTVWKDVPGYEGLYKVSDRGEIRSECGLWGAHYIDGFSQKNGYMKVALYKNKKKKTFQIHRVVASAFLENPYKKEQVNHKDGNKKNNCVTNLEWCTQSENQIHAFKMGLNRGRKGEENVRSRSIIQYDKNMNKIAEWGCMSTAQEKLGINVSNICNCCKGKIKSIGGFVFKYKEELL